MIGNHAASRAHIGLHAEHDECGLIGRERADVYCNRAHKAGDRADAGGNRRRGRGVKGCVARQHVVQPHIGCINRASVGHANFVFNRVAFVNSAVAVDVGNEANALLRIELGDSRRRSAHGDKRGRLVAVRWIAVLVGAGARCFV